MHASVHVHVLCNVIGGLSVEMKGSCAVQLSTVCDPSLVRIVEVRGHQEHNQITQSYVELYNCSH